MFLDKQAQYGGEYQDIFGLDLFSSKPSEGDYLAMFSGDKVSLEYEYRIRGEIDRILEKVSNKQFLETRELQIYSLHTTIEMLSSDQEPQKIKYKSLIREILDFRGIEGNLD
ncbi:MAG: hypothetical protein PHS92_00260 [Candidatus Gracilibacteria bacterium]|nr:hypothetical protein [Candidatus Gracilibacteria bacterium]